MASIRSKACVGTALALALVLALCALSGAEGRVRARAGRGRWRRKARAVMHAGDFNASDVDPLATDPRSAQRVSFNSPSSSGVIVDVYPTNVVVLLVGDGFSPCLRLILQDVLQSLDNNTIRGAMPMFNKPKGGFGCTPTVNAWWGAVRSYKDYNDNPVTGALYYYGVYRLTSADVNGVLNAKTLALFDSQIVNPVAQQGFKPFNAAAKKSTIAITIIGKNVKYAAFPKAASPFRCAVGFFRSDTYFPGYYGGIVSYLPGTPRWDSACVWFPKISPASFSRKAPNNCPQADYLTSHILARLADLMVNPSQFNWNNNKIGFPVTTSKNLPGYTCTQALSNGLYSKTAMAHCSPAEVCDMRLMSTYTMKIVYDSSGTPVGAGLNAPANSPEDEAFTAGNLGSTPYGYVLINVLSARYYHWVQPYRFSSRFGKCRLAFRDATSKCT